MTTKAISEYTGIRNVFPLKKTKDVRKLFKRDLDKYNLLVARDKTDEEYIAIIGIVTENKRVVALYADPSRIIGPVLDKFFEDNGLDMPGGGYYGKGE